MFARRLIAAAVLLGSTACSSVHSVAPPVSYIQANNPDQVWITTNSGTQSLMYRPRIADDSIFGFDTHGQQMVMPVEIVQAAQVKTLDRQKSFLAGAAIVAVAGVGVYILAKNAATTGRKDCSGNGVNTCEGKSNGSEAIRTSNGGIAIPVSASKVASTLVRALLGSR